MDSIKVKPSTERVAVQVATDEVDSVHYPIYKMAIGGDGEAILVDTDNPLPINDNITKLLIENEVVDLLGKVLKELKKVNAYNAMAHGEELENGDIE